MQTPASSSSRKRRRSDQYPFEHIYEGACQTASKKRKVVHFPDPQQPATHQGHSSVIPLTRPSLRELKRQNMQAARESRANQRIRRRPATRLAVAEWKRCHRPLKPAHTYLKNRGTSTTEPSRTSPGTVDQIFGTSEAYGFLMLPVCLCLLCYSVPESGRSLEQPNGSEPDWFSPLHENKAHNRGQWYRQKPINV